MCKSIKILIIKEKILNYKYIYYTYKHKNKEYKNDVLYRYHSWLGESVPQMRNEKTKRNRERKKS